MLTVLVATHNGARTLPRVLAAYTRLTAPRGGWKLVVIDNGCDDDSPRIARSFRDRLPLTCVSIPTAGKNRALNVGLRELEGDLAVFSDDDGLPEPDWLRRWRDVVDEQSRYSVFGGRIAPLWDVEPADWMLRWVRLGAVYSASDPAWETGPCEPTRVWGVNMAVRAELFAKGHRFDESIGPTSSPLYAMGSETEFALRVAIAERFECWYSKDPLVHHVIPADKMTRAWVLGRAFRLGRCVYRESRQKAGAGRPHVRRDAPTIVDRLAREATNLAVARWRRNARGTFEARWQLNLWIGCLFEAVRAGARRRALDSGLRA